MAISAVHSPQLRRSCGPLRHRGGKVTAKRYNLDNRDRAGLCLIIRSARAIILRRELLALRAFLGPMPADKAAYGRTDDAVMAGVMSGHAANHRALEATFGGDRRGCSSQKHHSQ